MRYPELDIARGFTVLLMPAVHVTMLYGNQQVYNSWWGASMAWIASFPGAQLFMMLMGISFALSGKSNVSIQKKGLLLLLFAYVLNACKFLLPAAMGWLSPAFLAELDIKLDCAGLTRLLLVGDILQLAAISLCFLSYFRKYNIKDLILLILVLLIAGLAPYLYQFSMPSSAFNEIASLFTGNDPLSFFPIFPWLVYPLIGWLIGKALKEGRYSFGIGALLGLALMLPVVFIEGPKFYQAENLYRPDPLQTVFHTGFCLVWLWVCSLSAKFLINTMLLAGFTWCSKRITSIYLSQWVIIFCCMGYLPYRGLTLNSCISWSVIFTTFVTILIHGVPILSKKLSKLLVYGRNNHL